MAILPQPKHDQALDSLFHASREEIFANIWSEHPWNKLKSFPLTLTFFNSGEEADSHLATAPCQGILESKKVTPDCPFLQAEPMQLPQLFLIRL